MLVVPGTESRSTPKVRNPDGRTDIPLYFPAIFEARHDHDPHAIIECKRIAGGNARLCREYVREGIDRFASGKYGSRHPVGFMAGYLESGTADLAAKGINRYLDSGGRRAERLRSSAAVHADWARSSRHPRPSVAKPIDLHHAFLAFA